MLPYIQAILVTIFNFFPFLPTVQPNPDTFLGTGHDPPVARKVNLQLHSVCLMPFSIFAEAR